MAVLTDITRALPDEQVHTRLASLTIQDFRNYDGCRLEIDAPKVLLLGENGSGKTNLMEAVSLLAPGRGLRRAKAEHLPRQTTGRADWAVSARVTSGGETVTLGTGVRADSDGPRRVMRRDGETVSQAEVGRLFSVSWLTPRMDGIFIDSPGARRRFLDRLVIAFDPAHIGRTSRYEKMLRERTTLLSEGRGDEAWLSAIEASLAESAVAVTAARQSLISDLNAEAAEGWFGFPGVALRLDGTLESWLEEGSALAAEDRFIADARARRAAGDPGLAGHMQATCRPATASPAFRPALPRPASRRRCSLPWCWRMRGFRHGGSGVRRCCCWMMSSRISTWRGAARCSMP